MQSSIESIASYTIETPYTGNTIDEATKTRIRSICPALPPCELLFLTVKGVDLAVMRVMGLNTNHRQMVCNVLASPGDKLRCMGVLGEGKNYEAAMQACIDKLAKLVDENILR